MEQIGLRVPAAVLELVKDEAKVSWSGLARDLNCTEKSIYRWKEKGLTLDALVALLRFATARNLERAEAKLAHHLKDACGPNVQIILVARRNRRPA